MSQWFRFYVEVLDDPKVQCLPPKTFKNWVNILCLAKRGNGVLPALSDIAFALRLPEQETKQLIETLQEMELLEQDETGMKPHNWNSRQYMHVVSTERVKRFRKRKQGVSRNVAETVGETPPDTETDTDSERASESSQSSDSAEPQIAEQAFEPIPFEMIRPLDYQSAVWGAGLTWLAARTGRQETALKTLLGKWLKLTGNDAQAIFELMQAAERQGIGEPVAWIEAALQSKPPTPLEAAQERGKDLEAAGHG